MSCIKFSVIFYTQVIRQHTFHRRVCVKRSRVLLIKLVGIKRSRGKTQRDSQSRGQIRDFDKKLTSFLNFNTIYPAIKKIHQHGNIMTFSSGRHKNFLKLRNHLLVCLKRIHLPKELKNEDIFKREESLKLSKRNL